MDRAGCVLPSSSSRVPLSRLLLFRLFRRLALSCAALLAAFVVGEIAARVWLARFADDEQFQRYASYADYEARYDFDNPRFTPHWYLGYQATPDWVDDRGKRGLNRHNALGFRGEELEVPKPPSRFRIACLGGSTTYTTRVQDHRLAYPHLLGEKLRARGYDVDVVNAGLAGWSSWETLINFQFRVLDLEPDLIVVYHAVNDFHNRFVWPPEAFTPDNTGRHRPAETKMFVPPLADHSTLLRTIRVAAGFTPPLKDRVADLMVPVRTWLAGTYMEQWRAGTYPSGIFAQVPAEEMLAQNPPDYFRRNIDSLVALARANGVEVVLATFAHAPGFPDSCWSDCELHWEGYAEHNAITKEVAAARDAHLFDFAAEFPQDVSLYADGIHVTKKGARLKAEAFADFLVAAGVLPR